MILLTILSDFKTSVLHVNLHGKWFTSLTDTVLQGALRPYRQTANDGVFVKKNPIFVLTSGNMHMFQPSICRAIPGDVKLSGRGTMVELIFQLVICRHKESKGSKLYSPGSQKKCNLTIDLLSLGVYAPKPQVLTYRPQILREARI